MQSVFADEGKALSVACCSTQQPKIGMVLNQPSLIKLTKKNRIKLTEPIRLDEKSTK